MRTTIPICSAQGHERDVSLGLVESVVCNSDSSGHSYCIDFVSGDSAIADEIATLKKYGFNYMRIDGSFEEIATEFGLVLLSRAASERDEDLVAFNPLCIQPDNIVACEHGVTIGSNNLIVPFSCELLASCDGFDDARDLIVSKFQPYWDLIAAEQAAENAPAGPSVPEI